MEEKTKLNWKPEDNGYLNNILDKLNVALAFMVILAPLISSLCFLIGVKLEVMNVYIIFYAFYIFVRVFFISLNFRFFKFRKLDLLEILGLSLLAMIFISSAISGGFNSTLIFTVGYFFVFLTFVRLDKKYYKVLLYTFIFTITICSIMGLCDLHNKFMPGFFMGNPFAMSLQFFNPNYTGYITIMAIVMCMFILFVSKIKWEQIIFWICYVVLNVALFINGCFSAETALFVAELFLLLYLWIKNKKCPFVVLICLFISIGSSFVWIKGVSSSGANFMFEALAVIDGKLNTHLVEDLSTFFDKIFHTGIIYSVDGSNGWDRADLKTMAIKEITSSPSSFIFGQGAGYNFNILVHNVALQFCLEYGIVNLILYVSILVVLVVRLFKSNFANCNVFLFALMTVTILISHYFGCLDTYSFTYYVMFLAVSIKLINERIKQKDESLKSEKKDGKK